MRPIGEILSSKGRYKEKYETYYSNPDITIDAHTAREDAERYLMALAKNRDMNPRNPKYLGVRNSSSNFVAQVLRLPALDFISLGDGDDERYFPFPNWNNQRLYGDFKRSLGEEDPVDTIESKYTERP